MKRNESSLKNFYNCECIKDVQEVWINKDSIYLLRAIFLPKMFFHRNTIDLKKHSVIRGEEENCLFKEKGKGGLGRMLVYIARYDGSHVKIL